MNATTRVATGMAAAAAVAASLMATPAAQAGEPIASYSVRQVQHRTVQWGDVCFDQTRHRDIARAVWPAETVSYGAWSRWANWSAGHGCLA